MNGLVGAGGDGKDVLSRVEAELADGCGIISALQFLDAVTRVSAENLDDVATFR